MTPCKRKIPDWLLRSRLHRVQPFVLRVFFLSSIQEMMVSALEAEVVCLQACSEGLAT